MAELEYTGVMQKVEAFDKRFQVRMSRASEASRGEVIMAIDARLQQMLDQDGLGYQIIHHVADRHALRTAQDTHTPAKQFAKVVVVCVDDHLALAVLPATHYLAPSRLAREVGANIVRLASEAEIRRAIPAYEPGTAPPFSSLCGLPVYVSPLLAAEEFITFNAGTHCDALRLLWKDYERLAKPKVAHLSHHEEVEPGGASG